MNTDSVLGYSRPAMLGGSMNTDPDALTIRWYGTSNYELNFHDRVVLLDTFYDRGMKNFRQRSPSSRSLWSP